MEDDTHTMDSECINIDDDKDGNYHCNEPSASGTNQLFNADVSGGSCYVFQSSYTELSPPTLSCLSAIPEDDASGREAIVECIFHSLDLLDKMGGSLNNFEELLLMARSMYCKGASLNQDIDVEEVVTKWPKTWADARKHLVDVQPRSQERGWWMLGIKMQRNFLLLK